MIAVPSRRWTGTARPKCSGPSGNIPNSGLAHPPLPCRRNRQMREFSPGSTQSISLRARIFSRNCRRDPTTARRGDFWLLGFPPGPIRLSLADLVVPDSSRTPISTPCLVWTPGRREKPCTRPPDLKPSAKSDLQVAWITGDATLPVERRETFAALCSTIWM
ncbi:hypothetical protein JTB14_011112 [Gonioctena quinquepunctata]|nr:hypothetical protein JTB14_011112 [Gonioctena quinquepunctata]